MDSKSIIELRKEASDFNLFNEIVSDNKDEELEKIIYKHKRRKKRVKD
jgi:predicted CopG family antitoxin